MPPSVTGRLVMIFYQNGGRNNRNIVLDIDASWKVYLLV
jgi:hypothetical protein